MSGWKDWAIGEVVTESEFQSFVQDQVVQVYADATDRDNTLGANVTEGMMCYLKDVDLTQVYDGSNWISTVGDITEVVAGDGLSGGGSSGSVTLSVDESALEITKSQVTDFAHASTHESGGSDEIEIAQSQVTGLDTGTEGFTAVSNGTAGLSYQPISHNYIINGAFDIWQRGDGPFNDEYSADRWVIPADFGTVTKENLTPGDIEEIGFGESPYFLRHESEAGEILLLDQRMEDVRTLSGQVVTLSFYAKAESAFGGTVQLRQNFGSGGSAEELVATIGFQYTTSWQRYEFQFTMPSVSGKTIGPGSYVVVRPTRVLDSLAHTVDLWGVQLEAGSIATPFKRNANSLAGELQACQRYYLRLTDSNSRNLTNGNFYNANDVYGVFRFPVEMRATPALGADPNGTFEVVADNQDFAVSNVVGALARINSLQILFETTTSGTQGYGAWLRIASGYIEFKGAEL